MPIISIIETIRQKLMLRFHKRFEKASTWEGIVTPKIVIALNKIIQQSRGVKLIPVRNEEFEVHEGPCKFVVSLGKKTCLGGGTSLDCLVNMQPEQLVTKEGRSLSTAMNIIKLAHIERCMKVLYILSLKDDRAR